MTGQILLILRLLLTASLYIFFGWALFILWQDLIRQQKLLAARLPLPITLSPSDPQLGAPQRYVSAEILIGRSPSNTLAIDDTTVSARHARLSYRLGQWWLDDLHSTNGTYLNDEPVMAPVVVTQGDHLRCGQVIFTISIGEKGETL